MIKGQKRQNLVTSIKNINQTQLKDEQYAQDIKFKRISLLEVQLDQIVRKKFDNYTYSKSIQGVNQIQKQIFRIEKFNQQFIPLQKQFTNLQNKQSIQEPPKLQSKKFHVKIQKRPVQLSLNRSKSQHHKHVRLANRNNSSMKNKHQTFNATRFSNNFNGGENIMRKMDSSQTSLKSSRIFAENKSKNKKISFNDTNIKGDFGVEKVIQNVQKAQKVQNNQIIQNGIKRKSIIKKVRVKANSVVSISQSYFRKKQTQCVPLQSQQIQEQDCFWQNAYRLRKGQVPVWYELQKIWLKHDQKRKNTINKQNTTVKQNKKTVYQGYDFNGQLIPAANFVTKIKKSQQVSDAQIIFSQENGIQNLQNYHERRQRMARTIKHINIPHSTDSTSNAVQSSFLNNFDKIDWNSNIRYIKQIESQSEDNNKNQNGASKNQENSKKLINQYSEQFQNIQKNKRLQKRRQIEQQVVDKTKEQQRMIEEFQKIKFYSKQDQISSNQPKIHIKKPLLQNENKQESQQENLQNHKSIIEDYDQSLEVEDMNKNVVNINTNSSQKFNLQFSKFLKVKKFHQKQKKSKSYNYHTCNHFTTPYKPSQKDTSHELKFKQSQTKGPQKVRANKRLFKEVFNMSLRYIQPQNREDIITIKVINDKRPKQMKNQSQPNENVQEWQNLYKVKTKKGHQARKSDTFLLKKDALQPRYSFLNRYRMAQCIKPSQFKPKTAQNLDQKNVRNSFDSMKSKRDSSQKIIENPRPFSSSVNRNTFCTKNPDQIIKSSKQLSSNKSINQISINVNKPIAQTLNKNQKIDNKNIDLQKVFKKQTKKTISKQGLRPQRNNYTTGNEIRKTCA